MIRPMYPETPEGVALAIMERILDAEDRASDGKRNGKPRDDILQLYGQCLAAAMAGVNAGAILN